MRCTLSDSHERVAARLLGGAAGGVFRCRELAQEAQTPLTKLVYLTGAVACLHEFEMLKAQAHHDVDAA